MTKPRSKTWRMTPKPGQSLTDIGAPLRTINKPPTNQCAPLPGSRRRPPPDGPVIVPKGLKVQHGPGLTYDARFQCAPGAKVYGAGFAAVGPGRDLLTGKAW